MRDTGTQTKKVLLFANEQWARCLTRIIESQMPEVVLEVVSIPPGQSLSKSVFVRKQNQLTVGDGADRPSAAGNDRALLFEWRDYDVVILQDIFAVHKRLIGDGERLLDDGNRLLGEGYVWGSTSYYELGNFSTRIICLCTDPAYVWYQESETLKKRQEALSQLSLALDEKRVIQFLDVHDENLVSRLTDSIRGSRQSQSPESKGETKKPIPPTPRRFQTQVHANAFQPLLDGLIAPTQLIFVDDDIEDLQHICQEMFGKSLSDQLSGIPPGCVNVVCVDTDYRNLSLANCTGAKTFEELVDKCSGYVKRAFETRGERELPCILVTDILFRVDGFADRTGVDLIGEMQRISGDQLQANNRLGVIAYTGFHSQFITMAAYNQGADYLILKERPGEGINSGHGLSNPGALRVALTIAYLCFQKQLLRDIRQRAKPCRPDDPKKLGQELLQELRRMLPETSISFHVRDEWRHTMTLLKSLQYFGATLEYHQRWEKISRHYDA